MMTADLVALPPSWLWTDRLPHPPVAECTDGYSPLTVLTIDEPTRLEDVAAADALIRQYAGCAGARDIFNRSVGLI